MNNYIEITSDGLVKVERSVHDKLDAILEKLSEGTFDYYLALGVQVDQLQRALVQAWSNGDLEIRLRDGRLQVYRGGKPSHTIGTAGVQMTVDDWARANASLQR